MLFFLNGIKFKIKCLDYQIAIIYRLKSGQFSTKFFSKLYSFHLGQQEIALAVNQCLTEIRTLHIQESNYLTFIDNWLINLTMRSKKQNLKLKTKTTIK
ncbi:hypothetical protein BpHYR1_042850 [Brachionus plicatilis]|uniref:Uncharacterized protein n=1 Tax=Brachionus plicatilis TaxID=10195 RepID=A0A3M7PLN0_BRAPC|nr:hypothetical protein BpHYR1_042850 [Brachionus plicatilis]